MIPKALSDEMKELVKLARDNGLVTSAEEAFKRYPPEGTWHKDENENIIIKEIQPV
jgi:hypothetical protein